MKLDLDKASRKLSELELKISGDNFIMDILWFRVMTTQGDWVINRHMHSTFEFHFISSGSCRVLLDDGEFEAGAGEFFLTAPGVFHEQRGVGNEKLIELCINCEIRLLEDIPCEAQHVLRILKDTPCKVVKDSENIMKLFHKALAEAYHQNLGFYNNIKSLAGMIVFSAARTIAGSTSIKYDIPLKSKKDDYRYAQIWKFIEDNANNPLTTSDIAKYMYLSEKQVCRIVQQARGISTKELVETVKHRKAKELLQQTDYSVKQIAEQLGFSSEFYFNQFFKRREGYSPGIFRSNTRE